MSDLAHRTFTADEKTKLKNCIGEAVKILQEVSDLKGGLSDVIKEVAEQLDVKPKLINAAIRIAYKQDLAEKQGEMSDVEELLVVAGIQSNVSTD